MSEHHIIIDDNRKYMEKIYKNKLMPHSKEFDLVVTSPPYFNLIDYSKKGDECHEKDIGRDQELEEYLKQIAHVSRSVKKLMKDNAHYGVVIRDITKQGKAYLIHAKVSDVIEKEGFILEDVKILLLLAHTHYDFLLVFRKKEFDGELNLKVQEWFDLPIWDLRNPTKSYFRRYYSKYSETDKSGKRFAELTGERTHPATFRQAIPGAMIEKYTKEGDWVLDPFLGSGTTMKMARQMGRNSVGIEINKEFLPLIKEKIGKNQQKFTEKQDMIVIVSD